MLVMPTLSSQQARFMAAVSWCMALAVASASPVIDKDTLAGYLLAGFYMAVIFPAASAAYWGFKKPSLPRHRGFAPMITSILLVSIACLALSFFWVRPAIGG